MARSSAVERVFQPVLAPSMFEETVERLGTAIRLGVLAPGARLPPERDLAEQLGISRSTLRQAITTLVQSGHLQSVRGRGGGTFVVERPPLTDARGGLPADWRGALDLRMAVEVGATVLAAERAEEEDLRRMDALVDLMAGEPAFEAYRRADMQLHIAVAEAARAPRVVHAMLGVQSEMSELIARIPHPRQVLAHSNDEHRLLVRALRDHDGGVAVAIVRRHLAGTEHILAGLQRG